MNITWDVTEPVKKHYSLKKEWDYNKPFYSCGLVMLCMNLIKWLSHTMAIYSCYRYETKYSLPLDYAFDWK
jgi:hypothetical protein